MNLCLGHYLQGTVTTVLEPIGHHQVVPHQGLETHEKEKQILTSNYSQALKILEQQYSSTAPGVQALY
jgi:hypothetical protein